MATTTPSVLHAADQLRSRLEAGTPGGEPVLAIDYDQGDNLLSTLTAVWPASGAEVTEVQRACWDAARAFLWMAHCDVAPGREGDAAGFNNVLWQVAEFVDDLEDIRHAELSPDGEGARFRDFGNLVRQTEAIPELLQRWESSLVGQ